MSTKRGKGSSKPQIDRVYAYIKRRPVSGATRKELSKRLRILHQSVGPRVVELLDSALVYETDAVRDGSRVLIAATGISL